VVAGVRDWADAQALLGRARMLKGDAAGAETALRAALLLNPSFASARADLGWALLAQGRTTEADEAFARALELDPLHALPRQQLAWRALLSTRNDGEGRSVLPLFGHGAEFDDGAPGPMKRAAGDE
jgi:Flp pilus assembly protein TadD